MKKRLLIILAVCLNIPMGMKAQSDEFGIWTSAEVEKRLFKGFDVFLEGEFRTRDGFGEVERWAATAGASYRITSYLKADASYTFIRSHPEERTTAKGNYIPSYWQSRHRISVSLTGTLKWNRLKFSLRERYQFTHRMSQYVAKYDSDRTTSKDDEEISSKSKNVLRSRLQVAWDIKKSAFEPYASCELYNDMSDGWSLVKTRWTAGTEYKINKKHVLDFFYRYQNKADDDEANGHAIGIGYKYKF